MAVQRRRSPKRSFLSTRSLSADDYAIPLPAIYFLSGLPALVYQTVWQRLLVLHSGVGTTSVAIIVAAYLLGLGVGSLVGAWLSRSLTASGSLRCFAALEVCIGLLAAISPWVFYDFLYLRHGWLYGELWRACLLHMGVLIIPTGLMGATLPLMTRALVREARTAPRSIGLLYGMNTLGAAVGAALAPWLLMPWLGVVGALWAGAACNIAVALMASRAGGQTSMEMSGASPTPAASSAAGPSLATAGGKSDTVSAAEVVEAAGVAASASAGGVGRGRGRGVGRGGAAAAVELRAGFGSWTLLYFLGGMCAIGLEIVWFRILDVAVKSTSFTFGTVLATFLSCMAAGSIVGAGRSSRITDPFRTFLAIQCQILITAGLLVLLLISLPTVVPGISWLAGYWGEENPLRPSREQLVPSMNLYVLLPLYLMGIPTFLMGYSFCVLQRGVQRDVVRSGYLVGLLQAANIAGCTAGSLLAGLWLLDVLGSMHTLRLIVSLGAIFAGIGMLAATERMRFVVYLGLTAAVCLLLPGNHQLWQRLHGQEASEQGMFIEDITSVCALTPQKNSSNWWMWANGKTQSLLPFGGFHSKLGILPVTLHPHPHSVAIIGLGSGDTAWAAACRRETSSVRVFEICTPEIRLLQTDFARNKWPQVDSLLNDNRVRIDPRDARFVLMTEDTTYDVIEADAIRHHGAYAGYLYSVEFFQLCGRRLNTGGLMCSWSPTPLTHTTFRRAFPYVLETEDGMLLIGSNEPIDLDIEGWASRVQGVEDYIQSELMQSCLNSLKSARMVPPSHPGDWVNTDLFPFDEFN